MKLFLSLCTLIALSSFPLGIKAFVNYIVIDDYTESLNNRWKENSIKGKTDYSVEYNDGIRCIRAKSDSSASALFYEIGYDLNEYPFLSWQWKIDHILTQGNALQKEGCDYAARICVVFPSVFFWKIKTLCYVWASSLPKGESASHPFSNNIIIIALQSGQENAGKWITEKPNVLQNFRDLFGTEPPKVGAIAIMTDTDNTRDSVTAWYGPIQIMGES
jgi:hypothetical protein